MKILINNQEQDNIKAIQVDDYWIVVDTKDFSYQKNKCVYSANGGIGFLDKENEQAYIIKNSISERCYDFSYTDTWYKIIASTKFIDKSIPVIKFVEYTTEELAEQIIKSMGWNWENTESSARRVAEYCAKQAKSSDKKYTEEDILIIRNKLVDILPTGNVEAWDLIQAISEYTKWFDEFIQSLNQPKLPDVINLEMVEVPYKENCKRGETNFNISKLKTTSTPEGEIIEIKF
jgi:hypothetical protein